MATHRLTLTPVAAVSAVSATRRTVMAPRPAVVGGVAALPARRVPRTESVRAQAKGAAVAVAAPSSAAASVVFSAACVAVLPAYALLALQPKSELTSKLMDQRRVEIRARSDRGRGTTVPATRHWAHSPSRRLGSR